MKEYPVTSYSTCVKSGIGSTCIEFFEHDRDRGGVRFFPDNSDLKDAEFDSEGKIHLNMRINRLNAVLDILRHQKPLYLFFEDGHNAGLRSKRETVGNDDLWIT